MSAHRYPDDARVDELFAAALELPAEERAAFVERACAGEESGALGAAVKELLRLSAEEGLGDDLRQLRRGELLRDLVRTALPELPEGSAPLKPGSRIGAYRITGEIGRGGMGTVYLGERVEGDFEQRVAIKVLRAGLGGGADRRRFEEERTILASLVHPHVARLYGGGSTEDGRPYFTMEHVEGLPVDRYCDEHRLTVAQRLELFEKVARAVHYAHRNLVIHRDIKPSNILVGSDGEPRLLDFGIARLASPEGAGTAATRRFDRRLTPGYASPELLRGGVVTTASDVYQLGLVLYELLTGQPAHRWPGKGTPSAADWERAVCDEEARPPSTTAARAPEAAAARASTGAALGRALRGDLDNIVLMALRKEPERRYASAEQLAQDIERFRANLPVVARQPTLGYRARKFAARNKIAVIAAALVLLSLCAGLVGTAWQAAAARRERDLARTEAVTADRVTGFLLDLFAVADPSESRGRSVTALELLSRGTARVDRGLKDQPAVRARLLDTLGRVHQALGLYDEARPLLEEGLGLRRETFGDRHAEVAESLASLASLHCEQLDCTVGEPLYREALELQRELFGDQHPQVARTLAELGRAVFEQGRIDEAERLLREALAMQERLLGEGHRDTAATHGELAVVLHSRGDVDGAEPLYRQALAVLQQELGDDHPRTLTALGNLAALLRARDDAAAAEPLMRRALAAKRQIFGDRHERVATAADNLGGALADLGRFEEAEALTREALAIRTELRGEGSSSLAMPLVNLGYVLYRKGDLAAAEPIFGKAVRVGLTGNPEHPQLGVASFWHGRALAGLGRPAAAEPELRRALGIYRKVYGESDDWTLDAQIALGRCLDALGRRAEAERLLLAGLDGSADESEQRLAAVAALVALYDAAGRSGEAARYRSALAELRASGGS